jgi:hypothetical protein
VVGYSTKNCRDKCLLAMVALIFRFVYQSLSAPRGNRGIAPLILNLGTKWRCVLNFDSAALLPGKNTRASWTGGRVVPKACLDVVGKRRIFFLLLGFELRTVEPVAQLPYRPRYPGSYSGRMEREKCHLLRQVVGIRCYAEFLEHVFRIAEYYIVITVTQPS